MYKPKIILGISIIIMLAIFILGIFPLILLNIPFFIWLKLMGVLCGVVFISAILAWCFK